MRSLASPAVGVLLVAAVFLCSRDRRVSAQSWPWRVAGELPGGPAPRGTCVTPDAEPGSDALWIVGGEVPGGTTFNDRLPVWRVAFSDGSGGSNATVTELSPNAGAESRFFTAGAGRAPAAGTPLASWPSRRGWVGCVALRGRDHPADVLAPGSFNGPVARAGGASGQFGARATHTGGIGSTPLSAPGRQAVLAIGGYDGGFSRATTALIVAEPGNLDFNSVAGGATPGATTPQTGDALLAWQDISNRLPTTTGRTEATLAAGAGDAFALFPHNNGFVRFLNQPVAAADRATVGVAGIRIQRDNSGSSGVIPLRQWNGELGYRDRGYGSYLVRVGGPIDSRNAGANRFLWMGGNCVHCGTTVDEIWAGEAGPIVMKENAVTSAQFHYKGCAGFLSYSAVGTSGTSGPYGRAVMYGGSNGVWERFDGDTWSQIPLQNRPASDPQQFGCGMAAVTFSSASAQSALVVGGGSSSLSVVTSPHPPPSPALVGASLPGQPQGVSCPGDTAGGSWQCPAAGAYGPGAGGYRCCDSLPMMPWAGSLDEGSPIGDGAQDDDWARVDLPFAFPWYGQTYTTAFFSTNGFVSFASGVTSATGPSAPLPGGADGAPTVAIAWADLYAYDLVRYDIEDQYGRGILVEFRGTEYETRAGMDVTVIIRLRLYERGIVISEVPLFPTATGVQTPSRGWSNSDASQGFDAGHNINPGSVDTTYAFAIYPESAGTTGTTDTTGTTGTTGSTGGTGSTGTTRAPGSPPPPGSTSVVSSPPPPSDGAGSDGDGDGGGGASEIPWLYVAIAAGGCCLLCVVALVVVLIVRKRGDDSPGESSTVEDEDVGLPQEETPPPYAELGRLGPQSTDSASPDSTTGGTPVYGDLSQFKPEGQESTTPPVYVGVSTLVNGEA